MDRPGHELSILEPPATLSAAAADLLGHEAAAAWSQTGTGDGVAIIAAMRGTDIAAGLLLFIESSTLENGPATGPVASIRQLVVPPESRGQGLAGRLIRRAIELANQRGCTRIRSTAGWGCPDHLMMYDRLRFTRASPADRPYLVSRQIGA